MSSPLLRSLLYTICVVHKLDLCYTRCVLSRGEIMCYTRHVLSFNGSLLYTVCVVHKLDLCYTRGVLSHG